MQYSILKASGKDIKDFLHRQSSNDINQLSNYEGTYVAFLNPQGKIRNLVFLIRVDDGYELIIEASKLDHLKDDLEKYAIIEEVSFEESKRDLDVDALRTFYQAKSAENQKLIPDSFELENYADNDSLIKLNLIGKYVSFTKGCFPGQETLSKFKNIGQKKRKERANKYLDEALNVFNSAPNEGDEAIAAQNKAIELLEKAIKDDPECEDAYETLGVILGRRGRYEEAIHVMKKLETMNPQSIMAQTNLSIFYMKLGDKETAEEHKAKGTVLQFDQALKQD